MYSMRLQVEMVEELLQCELHPMSSSVLSQMKVLDLSNQRLRDLSDVRFATLFPHLRKLVLDGNTALTEVYLMDVRRESKKLQISPTQYLFFCEKSSVDFYSYWDFVKLKISVPCIYLFVIHFYR